MNPFSRVGSLLAAPYRRAPTRSYSGEGLTTRDMEQWLRMAGVREANPAYSTHYQNSAPVYRAVQLRAAAVARGRPKIYRVASDGPVWLGEDDPVQQLLDRVDRHWTRARMWQAVETSMCIWGESYRYVDKSGGLSPDRWRIVWLHPGRVRPIVDDDTLVGYQYDDRGKRVVLLPEEVLFDRYFNPEQPWRGQSPLMAGMASAGLWSDMLAFNRAFFRNGLHSNVVFFLDQQTDLAEIERLRREIEDRYQGARNAHQPILSTGGPGSVASLNLSNREMEYLGGLAMAREQIADVYGVPEELMAGSQHSTYSNREAALRDFYQHTVAGAWSQYESEMQEQLIPMLPASYARAIIRFDRDEIDTLGETRIERYTREVALVNAGILTRNEIREGYGRAPVEGGESPVWLEVAQTATTERGLRSSDRLMGAYRADEARLSKNFERDLSAAFRAMGQRAAKAYREAVGRRASPDDEELVEIVMSRLGPDDIGGAWGDHYDRTLRTTAATVERSLGLRIGPVDDLAQRAIEAGGTRRGLVDFTTQTRRALLRAIEEGRALGEGANVLAERIQKLVPAGPFPKAGSGYRARMIARTETKHAQRWSQLSAYQASGAVRALQVVDDQLGYGDEDCTARNGMEVSFEEAEAMMALEHPNGTLDFLPVVN